MKSIPFNKTGFAFLFVIIIFFANNKAYSVPVFQFADSLNVSADSAAVADTISADTVKKGSGFDVDAVIHAQSSDSLIFRIPTKKMEIYGNSSLKYKSSSIQSSNIIINFNTNMMDAYPSHDKSDSSKYVGTPVLTEGSETYEGHRIKYNYKNQQGYISAAKTESEGSSYAGTQVKKVDKNTYFISEGMFSTCDLDDPHYYFSASEMKVILKSQIIAKWVWLYIGGVPLPVPLPFGVFPTQSGRRSGIIAPAYGQDNNRGYYFSHMGYFWAINDYMDINLTSDYYFRGGYGLDSRFRYVKRYNYSGNVEVSYSSLKTGESTDSVYTLQKDYKLHILHNQKFNPTTSLNANLYFQSGSYYRNNSVNLYDALSQNISSNATFSKQWEESGVSMNLNYSRNQNLSTGEINEILPNLTISKSQTYPFKGLSGDTRNPAWYESVGLNYSGSFQNKRQKDEDGLKIRGGVQHSLGISAPQKIGYITISPNASYRERWYNKKIVKTYQEREDSEGGDTVITNDEHEINFVRDFSMGVSANTRLYGMFPVNAFGVQVLRHTITPTISYNYTPDFSKDKWGYYSSYTDSAGNKIKYSKFEQEIFGGPGQGESQSIQFSLSNVFEIKTKKDPTDTTSQEKKIELLNAGASVSYNFAADSLRLSKLNLTYRTSIGNILQFNGSSSYAFYVYEHNAKGYGHYVNRYMASEGRGLFRLTSFSLGLSTSLSGDKIKGKEGGTSGAPAQDFNDGLYDLQGTEYQAIYGNEPPDFSIPWDLSLSYTFNINREDPQDITRTSSLTAALNMNLTPSWKLNVSGGYDFEHKDITAPQIRIYRDLHCWEMNFSWYPVGYYRGYRFEIRVKAPQLQDLKVTRDRGLFSGR